MKKNIRDMVDNEIEIDERSVWVLSGQRQFEYSDGAKSETYLEKVLLSANDLSSNSYELEGWIKDWPSEYHLSRKRAQLLRGFDFDNARTVLEVGCGCGAITRFLGETFEDVVAVEGSRNRAVLARLRTRDMKNVSIICAPFHDLKFKSRFDMIFCIGVFEYSNVFVNAPDPYDYILRYFHDILTEDGIIVLAIENQFGLKYFSSSKEDHTGIMFDGLEGYRNFGKSKGRTFGSVELKSLLDKNYECVDFYFPYPDYKTPSCILSEKFFQYVKAGELVGRFRSSPRLVSGKPLFDERLALLELDQNDMLPFFSNSFLVVAAKGPSSLIRLNCLGLIYSNDRRKVFQTVTTFSAQPTGSIVAEKIKMHANSRGTSEYITLHECRDEWIDGPSLHVQIMKRIKDKSLTMEGIFSPCRPWIKTIQSQCSYKGNQLFLDGRCIDYIWSNSFIINGECKFIDLEWEWHESIPLNLLIIRSIFHFLNQNLMQVNLHQHLKGRSQRTIIKRIAQCMGTSLSNKDFREFCKLESKIGEIVYGKSYVRVWFRIKVLLWNKCFLSHITISVKILKKIVGKARVVLTE